MTGFKKRAHDRHTLSLFMEVYEDDDYQEPVLKCRTNNIGIGGLMIHNKAQPLHEGVKVNVLLKATCRSGLKEFPVEAKIVWTTSDAIGMQFTPLNEEEEKEFKRFLFESKVAVHSTKRKRWRDNANITATVVQPQDKEKILNRN